MEKNTNKSGGTQKRETYAETVRKMREAEYAARKKRQNREKMKKAALLGAAALVLVGIVLFSIFFVVPSVKYSKAEKLLEKGKYLEAYEIFSGLGGFSDASSRASESLLLNAQKLAGREDILIGTSETMPWFEIGEKTGEIAFDEEKYVGDSTVRVPDVFDGVLVRSLRKGCFRECTFLTGVLLPASLERIGDRAFYQCTSLKEIDIPDRVTEIGAYAFNHCEALARLTIGEGVKKIGTAAFEFCAALKRIVLPGQVTEISSYAFNYCFKAEEVVFSSATQIIGEYAFSNCIALKKIELPSGVREIKEGAFSFCLGVCEVSLPSTLEKVGKGAFEDIEDLTTVKCAFSRERLAEIIVTDGNEEFLACKNIVCEE